MNRLVHSPKRLFVSDDKTSMDESYLFNIILALAKQFILFHAIIVFAFTVQTLTWLEEPMK